MSYENKLEQRPRGPLVRHAIRANQLRREVADLEAAQAELKGEAAGGAVALLVGDAGSRMAHLRQARQTEQALVAARANLTQAERDAAPVYAFMGRIGTQGLVTIEAPATPPQVESSHVNPQLAQAAAGALLKSLIQRQQ